MAQKSPEQEVAERSEWNDIINRRVKAYRELLNAGKIQEAETLMQQHKLDARWRKRAGKFTY